MTLGVRGLVIDKDQRILLITRTYVPGWQLPGGGVEPGETMAEALARELVEEGNIEILEPPVLHVCSSTAGYHRATTLRYLLCAPSVSSVRRHPIGRLPHMAFFLSKLFLRIRLAEHGPASPRLCWAHLFQNDGDEIGARSCMTEQGEFAHVSMPLITIKTDYHFATPLLPPPGKALGESIDLIVVATGKGEQLSDEFLQPSGALGKTDRSTGE